MTWSRISRRQLPTQRSAVPFCQGDWMLVRFGLSPVAFRKAITVASSFESRSRIAHRYRPASEKASRSGWTTQFAPCDSGERPTTVHSGRLGVEFHADSGRRSAQRQRIRASTTRHRAWGAPQSGFSSANGRISPRISSVTFGRRRRRRDRQRQYSRKPARCQLMAVSGFTITRTPLRRDQKRRNIVQNSQSKEFSMPSTAACS